MKLRKFFLTLVCVLTLASSGSLIVRPKQVRAFEGEAYAIKGATIVTVTGAVIQKGTIVIRDGLIAAVGADVAVPGDARVIDATGLTVYPGLFDSYTSYGLRAAETPNLPRGGAGAADQTQALLARLNAPPSNEGKLPEVSVVEQLQVAADTFDGQRAAGITTALTAPRNGIFQGQSALINLGDVSAEKLILKAPVSLNIGFGGGGRGGGGGGYPGSPMGVFAFLRQSLLDAQHYREEWDRYNKNPRGMQRPEVNKSLAALQPVIKGEMPVIFNVSSVREIQRAVGLAEEFKLTCYLAGAYQSYQIADYLKSKNATVLLSLSFPQKPAGLEDPESESLRTLKDRADAPTAAAALHKAGVRFAFISGSLTRPTDYVVNAARAIEAGLPKEEALKALTIYPAQIFGVGEQLGSIEKGKIANLIVTSGDLFAKDTKVRHVFVDGKYFLPKAPEQQRPGGAFAGGPGGGGRRGGPGGGGNAPAAESTSGSGLATGLWTLTVNSQRGEMKLTANLQQNGGAVTGELTLGGPLGVAQITKGSISGNEIELEYTVNAPNGQPMNGTLKGKIEGNAISGQMGMMGRNSEFTGAKTPKE